MNKKISLLIGIIFGFLVASLFTSCKKEPITPGNYQTTQPAQPAGGTVYTNGGTTPTGTSTATNNQLFGTNWVLTDVYFNYAHTAKNDTIHFVSNTKYTVGSDTTKMGYSLYSSTGSFNSTIDIYQFNPINGLYLSANNFNANAFASAPVGGTIFLNLKDNNTTGAIYVSTFKKI